MFGVTGAVSGAGGTLAGDPPVMVDGFYSATDNTTTTTFSTNIAIGSTDYDQLVVFVTAMDSTNAGTPTSLTVTVGGDSVTERSVSYGGVATNDITAYVGTINAAGNAYGFNPAVVVTLDAEYTNIGVVILKIQNIGVVHDAQSQANRNNSLTINSAAGGITLHVACTQNQSSEPTFTGSGTAFTKLGAFDQNTSEWTIVGEINTEDSTTNITLSRATTTPTGTQAWGGAAICLK